MTRTQAEAFRRLLEQYAEELASRVGAGIATSSEQRAAAMAREILHQLTRDLATATRRGVVITSDRVAQLYAEATAAMIARQGGGIAIEVTTGIGARAAAAVLARPELAASLRSIERDSVKAVDGIIRRSLLRGASTTQAAQELRLHILGADAFPPSALVDRRTIGYEVLRRMGYDPTPENLRLVRAKAGAIAGRAQLIARTEPMNAEWEAHRQGAIVSPVVRAIEWRLSRRHPVVDQCDVLAEADLYGLGPGLYDPRSLPRRPHPRCICIHRDVLYDPEDWGTDRGALPPLLTTPEDLGARFGLNRSQTMSLRDVLQPQPPQPNRARPKITVVPTVPKATITQRELRRSIRAREREIAPLPVEWGTVWDPKTGNVLINKTSNERSFVRFTSKELALFKDAIFTHNHPSGSSFSPADLSASIHSDLLEVRATGIYHDHSMKRPAGGWPDGTMAFDRASKEVKALQDQAKAEAWTPLRMRNELHAMWKWLSKELGITYRRTVHKP